LGSSLVSWFFSKRIGKSLGLNGAAFAIRRKAFESLGGFRKTIPDDFDLITRSFFNNFSFRYTNRISVSIKPQTGWKEWYKQRVRWGIATGVWLKDYYKPLAKILVQKPQIVFSSLLLLMPAFLLFFLNFLLPQAFYNNFVTLASTVLLRHSSFALPSFHLTVLGNLVAKNGVVIILAYSAFSSIFYMAARKLRYYFNPLEFLCYYLIYSPLSLLMFVIGIFRVITHKDRIDIDWKI
jgi:cellulose synthase/poly-beta-1,6-N-acetylglucosamine synthase-like glycosyltransferase